MLPTGIRLSLVASRTSLNAENFLSISARCATEAKLYRSTRERPLIADYQLKGRPIRLEAAQREDIPLMVDFMSEIAARQEPTSISTGATAEDFKPFTAKLLEAGLKYSIIVMDEDRVIGGGIGNIVDLNPKYTVEPRIRDYGEVIDKLAEWFPSRKMRRVVAPAYDLCNMVSHFLPEGTKQVMRYELCCVHASAVGGNIIKKIIYEVTRMGLRDGVKWGDAQTTAAASYRAHVKNGAKPFFRIPYEKMFDHGKRIHKNVPLHDGSPALTGLTLELDIIAKNSKC